ncbi:hypothetical protein GCM10010405_12590 [Streptomyces macrosporus]|uniref:Glycerol uptake facilitator protein n=1 Tax=Streptomyces macrosporus TaxID=44032 RepID=A0ABN3JIB3_9ACTN
MPLGIAVQTGENRDKVPVYIAGQIIGAMLGAVPAWLTYHSQFAANRAKDTATPTLGVFSTIPEIRTPVTNLITEIIATIALVLPIPAFGLTTGLGESGALVLVVTLPVVGIGLSLGGPTGYAINPARGLGPRIDHSLLPIPNKGTSDRGYSWVPVVGPLIGGVLAAWIYNLAF